MTGKTAFEGLLQAYADACGDLDLRLFIGTPGYRIEVRNETQDTGQGYAVPSFLDGLTTAVGGALDRMGRDEVVVALPAQSAFVLTHVPRSASALLVFKDGLLLPTSAYSLVENVVTTAGMLGQVFVFVYAY